MILFFLSLQVSAILDLHFLCSDVFPVIPFRNNMDGSVCVGHIILFGICIW